MKHDPKEVKLEAVRLFFEEGLTRAEITATLGLRRKGRVKAWVRQDRQAGAAGFSKPQGRPRKEPESAAVELERLRMENALLKK